MKESRYPLPTASWMSRCLMTFFSFLCRLTRKISAHESPYLTASAEARVESLTTANQLAGRRFGIRQLAEDNGTSKQAIGVVLGIPLASTPTTLNLKVPKRMKILVLNSGSSSQKACLYEIAETLPDNPPACLWEGKLEWLGDAATIEAKNSRGVLQRGEIRGSSRAQLLERLLGTLWQGEVQVISSARDIDVVGHRVVHGGPHYEEPTLVTPEVQCLIASMQTFAPLHIQAELEGIDIIGKLLRSVPQVAVFDTGFHRQMPLSAAVYPGPYEWFEGGIRRYGFHGINRHFARNMLPSYCIPT